ncbi:WhiB family transcriptional regulator [Nocardia sp. NPDC006044]|uniref:WhiB family transcriptional regulator n=1 Tax=Nocardia sp. NPDC006044 TaxID=3364306 RepID=UPI0036CC81B5
MRPTASPKRLCQNIDPEVFFPEGTNRPAQVAFAQTICRGCPVLRSCAAEALRLGITHGVVASVDLSDPLIRPLEEAKRRLQRVADGRRVC